MEENHTPKYPVQSLEKALDILNLLAKDMHADGLGISAISEKLNIGKSTVHRILDTLQAYQFIEKSENRNVYRLGWALNRLGNAVLEQHNVTKLDFSQLEELSDKYNETVNVGMLNRSNVVIIHKIEPDVPLMVSRQIGQLEPVYATALGKVLSCDFSDQKLMNIFQNIEFKQYTPNTIIDFQGYKQELKKVQEQQFAMDEEEYCLGLTCIACPIKDNHNKTVAGISVSGPTIRWNFNKILSVKEDMFRISAKLTEQFGREA